MQILNIRPEPPGRGNTLARFDVQITDEVRLFNLKLINGPRGRRVHSPHAFGANVATFAPALADQIMRAACAAFESANPHDHPRR